MGDENVFGFHNDLVAWDRNAIIEKNSSVSINVKEIVKGVQRKV